MAGFCLIASDCTKLRTAHVQNSNISNEAVIMQYCYLINQILNVVYIYANNVSQVMLACTSRST